MFGASAPLQDLHTLLCVISVGHWRVGVHHIRLGGGEVGLQTGGQVRVQARVFI